MDQPTPQETPPASPETPPVSQETTPPAHDTPPAAPPQNIEDLMVQGCLSVLVVLGVLTCVAVVALASMGTMVPGIPLPSNVLSYVLRAAVYGVLAIPFGLVAIFLKQDRFRMWRGLALALAIAGLYGLVMGLVLAASHITPAHTGTNPDLPAWVSPTVSLVFSLVVIGLTRSRFLGKPDYRLLLFAAGLGLVISVGWLWVGTLGDVVELWLGTLDALSVALIGAVLLRMIFFFDPEMLVRHPFWASLLAGATFSAVLYILMASRGYAIQGGTLANALLLAGVTAGVLLTLGEQPDPTRTWWAALTFLFFALLIPFNWTEGFEGDYMYTDLTSAWLPATMATLLIGLVVGAVLLAARRWLASHAARPAVAFSVVGWGVVVSAVVYLAIGRPGMQAETFFVVLKDQADTSSAMKITDLDQRRQDVYDTLVKHADSTQAPLRQMLDAQHVTYRPYYLVNGMEVDGNPIVRAQIAARPDVARILASPHARSLPSFTEGFAIPGFQMVPSEPGWDIEQMNVPEVWKTYNVSGEGIVVGSADTGVEWTHTALRTQYLGSETNHNYTWYDPWYGHPAPDDVMGHGTHTTGTMVGQGGIGVAPSAKFIACRNLGRDLGNPAVYLDCMQFLFAPFPLGGNALKDGDPKRGADVVNNSWGCPPAEGCDAITLSVAVDHLYHAGQMYVISAGNDGPDCSTITAPANAEHGLSIGALGEDGTITGFSSRGPITNDGSGRIKPDVAAPGENVVSAVPGGGYAPLDGTSMAGPHVAGLVALLWSANPQLKGDIDATVKIIEETSHYQTAPDLCGAASGNDNNVYGYGTVDALAAVKAALGK